MDAHTWIYFIQAGFNNLVRLTVGGSFALTAWKLHYYFKDRDAEINHHKIQHSEHSINLFKNEIKPKILFAYKQEHNKILLNKRTQVIMARIQDQSKNDKYMYDELSKSQQLIVKHSVKQSLLNKILDILEEWALGVEDTSNNPHLIFMETHDDLLSFIKNFQSEFTYATMNMDGYRAIVNVVNQYERSNIYEED